MTSQGTESAAGAAQAANTAPKPKIPRKHARHAVAVVLDRLGDGHCERLADTGPETRTVLAALFQPMRKGNESHGHVPPAERTEWLDRCRAWVAEQGYTLAGTNIPLEYQARYVKATGDAYTGPSVGPRLQKYATTRVDAQAKRRSRERAESPTARMTPDQARAYRMEVRAWGRAKGREVSNCGPLNPDLVAAFEAAKRAAS